MAELGGIVLGGIGDESGPDLSTQILAHESLGWRHMELRSVGGTPVGDLPPQGDAALALALERAGLSIPVLCSRIGGWSGNISSPWQEDCRELDRLIQLGGRLGSRMIRVMSYPNDGLSDDEWGRQVTERVSRLAEIANRSGMVLALENCSGWAAHSADRTLALIQDICSPALGVLFDIGNPVVHGYDGYAFLEAVADHVVHVHVKDARRARTEDGEAEFCLPGKGDGRVADCLRHLIRRQWRGMWSIEPHLALIPHLRRSADEESLLRSFDVYGRAFSNLLMEL